MLIRRYLSLVKFEHTIFALPMAYAGMLLALHHEHRHVTTGHVIWITVAMAGARTLAMALNRLIDARIDAANPRTATREIPAGLVSRAQGWLLCLVSLVALLGATTQLAGVTRWLWPIPVALFVLYPYCKRFTWLCHLVLGVSTGLAPVGAWIAVTGSLTWTPVALGVAHAFWVGGFDLVYATQDVDYDRSAGLQSLPARFGIGTALGVMRIAHLITVLALIVVGVTLSVGVGYWIGVAVVAALLAYENSIVRADDLRRVNAAFFTTNGVISMLFLAGVIVGVAA